MKLEKEIMWIVKLYNCSACKDVFQLRISPDPMCKKDFERIVGASENNKEFYEWFDVLLKLGVFRLKGKIKKGIAKTTDCFIVDSGSLVKYAKEHPLYKMYWKMFNRDRVI